MRGFVLALALALAAPQTAAFAQSEVRVSVTGYGQDYFAGAQPASAMDMVMLVPGFRLVEGNALVRGYSGALGNILIDGSPPASKQDLLEDILKRIPAASVERVELIRPGAAGIDMQGFPLMVNVVRKPNIAPRGRIEAELATFRHQTYAPKVAAELSIGATSILNLSAAWWRAPQEDLMGYGQRNILDATGAPLLLSHYEQPKYDEIWTVMAGYRQPLLGGAINLNALYKDDRAVDYILERHTFPTAVTFTGGDKELHPAMEFKAEYDHGLWDGAETQFTVIRRDHRDKTLQFSDQTGPVIASLKDARWSETVARDLVRHRSGRFTLEAGAEGAINTLNNKVGLTNNGAAVPLPAANVLIKEKRAEFSGNLVSTISPDISLETGVRYEMSVFTQRGDSNLDKSLAYLKPRALLTWKATKDDELRFLYERKADQLNFINFVSFVVVSIPSVSSGNKNQVPSTLWRKSVAWEHHFGNSGSIVVTGRREEISDVLDRIALLDGGIIYDSPGNVGDGWREELQMDLILPLDWTGVPGFTLQGTGLYRNSGVRDAATGMRHRITRDVPEEGKITLTHDLPRWNMRWGVTYRHEVDKKQFRYNEYRSDHLFPRLDVFVEYKPDPEWLIRLFGRNLTDANTYSLRTTYVGGGIRGTVPVNYTEHRPLSFGPAVGINIQRTFGG